MFPKGSKKMSLCGSSQAARGEAALLFACPLGEHSAACMVRDAFHLGSTSAGFSSQAWLGEGQSQPCLQAQHCCQLLLSGLCPTTLSFLQFPLPKQSEDLLPRRKGMFLAWDHWSRDPCRAFLIWVRREKSFKSIDSFQL